MTDQVDRKYFTMVFEGDLRSFEKNPLTTNTPFGRPLSAGFGNAFEQLDSLTAPLPAEIEDIQKRHEHDDQVFYSKGVLTSEIYADRGVLIAALRASEARAAAAYEDAAKIADEWNITQTLLQRAGEMTAQECRSVKAVVTAIAAAIRAKANGGK